MEKVAKSLSCLLRQIIHKKTFGLPKLADSTLSVCENVVSAKVNPHAKGLVRLEESVALSQKRVRDHTTTFMASRPFYFLTLCPAADADQVLYFTVSLLKLKVKSIPAQSGRFRMAFSSS